MTPATIALLPSSLLSQRAIKILQIILASLFIGICAQIKIPLYFTSVPLTGATLAIMLVAATLGSRKGTLAVLCYLIQSYFGFPSSLNFMGPTGGYIIGYVVEAYVIGWLLKRQSPVTATKLMAVLLFAAYLQLSLGSLWLAQFVGIKHCFSLGFYPFILIEVIKASLITIYVKNVQSQELI